MKYASGRHFLQIPGPTNVPDRILRAMDQAVICFVSPKGYGMAKLQDESLVFIPRNLLEDTSLNANDVVHIEKEPGSKPEWQRAKTLKLKPAADNHQ